MVILTKTLNLPIYNTCLLNAIGIGKCGSLSSFNSGRVSVTTYAAGGIATYSCYSGYTLSGSPTRTCLSGGSWSGSQPTCLCKLN